MKLFIAALLVCLPYFAVHADEDSANSARSSENSPVIPAAEGEGELSLDTDKPPKTSKAAKGFDGICRADSDPADCKSDKKLIPKKKKPKLKPSPTPGANESFKN